MNLASIFGALTPFLTFIPAVGAATGAVTATAGAFGSLLGGVGALSGDAFKATADQTFEKCVF